MASTVGWLNFDAEQQRRTELMMAAIAEQGTIDELGLGDVRDLIARALHPGITVLQTRARYLVFLPHLYQSIQGSTTEALWENGRKREGTLVNDLNSYYREQGDDDDRGIIGRNRAEKAKQPASVAYWGLMRQLGILRLPKASVSDYCTALLTSRQHQAMAAGLHDDDLAPQSAAAFWSEFPAPDAKGSGFNLSHAEAEWLQERFVAAGAQYAEDERPLWAHLLSPQQQAWFPDVAYPWQHPGADQFPSRTREAMLLGRDLDQTIHGARVLYNYLCSAAQSLDHAHREEWVARYENAMQTWQDTTATDGLPSVERLDSLHEWAQLQLATRGTQLARMRVTKTIRFVKDWHQIATTSNNLLTDERAAELLKKRESFIKPGRARLANKDRMRDWNGSAGAGHFSYNWAVTSRLLTDIHRGLGTEFVEGDAA
ncbi:hypothetical protein IEE94_13585 [Yimella sp. cx-573]|nr:hypothetical protein [Yimella sp. cx-573]